MNLSYNPPSSGSESERIFLFYEIYVLNKHLNYKFKSCIHSISKNLDQTLQRTVNHVPITHRSKRENSIVIQKKQKKIQTRDKIILVVYFASICG